MNRYLSWIAVLGLAMSAGCGSNRNSSVGGIPVRSTDLVGNARPLTRVDKEAASLALDSWKPTHIGESYYLCQVATKNNTVDRKELIELRNPEVILASESLSQADKLNGVEWRGHIVLRAAATRSYCTEGKTDTLGTPVPADTAWSEWTSGNDILKAIAIGRTATKTNGKWSVEDPASDLFRMRGIAFEFKQVQAVDLPKGD